VAGDRRKAEEVMAEKSFGYTSTEAVVRIAELEAENTRLREALSSMRGIFENQQMSTLQVARTMLDTTEQALATPDLTANANKKE
jgi:hypothetical protein